MLVPKFKPAISHFWWKALTIAPMPSSKSMFCMLKYNFWVVKFCQNQWSCKQSLLRNRGCLVFLGFRIFNIQSQATTKYKIKDFCNNVFPFLFSNVNLIFYIVSIHCKVQVCFRIVVWSFESFSKNCIEQLKEKLIYQKKREERKALLGILKLIHTKDEI